MLLLQLLMVLVFLLLLKILLLCLLDLFCSMLIMVLLIVLHFLLHVLLPMPPLVLLVMSVLLELLLVQKCLLLLQQQLLLHQELLLLLGQLLAVGHLCHFLQAKHRQVNRLQVERREVERILWPPCSLRGLRGNSASLPGLPLGLCVGLNEGHWHRHRVEGLVVGLLCRCQLHNDPVPAERGRERVMWPPLLPVVFGGRTDLLELWSAALELIPKGGASRARLELAPARDGLLAQT